MNDITSMNDLRCGWLSPKGDFYECHYMEHFGLADQLCGSEQDHPDDVLLYNGWVKISLGLLGNRTLYVIWERSLTDIQINFVYPYIHQNLIEVDYGTLIMWEKEMDERA